MLGRLEDLFWFTEPGGFYLWALVFFLIFFILVGTVQFAGRRLLMPRKAFRNTPNKIYLDLGL